MITICPICEEKLNEIGIHSLNLCKCLIEIFMTGDMVVYTPKSCSSLFNKSIKNLEENGFMITTEISLKDIACIPGSSFSFEEKGEHVFFCWCVDLSEDTLHI